MLFRLLLILLCTVSAWAQVPLNTARVHFFRPDSKYTGWTVYAFNDTTADTGNYNGGPIVQTGSDDYGAYYDVPLKPGGKDLGFIVHNIQTGAKNTPADLHLNIALYNEVWIISGDPTTYLTRPTAAELLNANFGKQQAFWIDRATLLIQSAYAESGGVYKLYSDPQAGLVVTPTGLSGGGTSLTLTPNGALTPAQIVRFPQLKTGYTVLTLPGNLQAADYQTLLRGQLGVSVQRANGTLRYATGVQQAGVLDDLYAYSGPLGFMTQSGVGPDICRAGGDAPACGTLPQVRLWAPTAQSVQLQLFNAAADTTPALVVPMQEANGLWTASINRRWTGRYYLFAVQVYAPGTRSIVQNIVTDPYSIDLAVNGTKTV